jgi:hypothetical protein
MRRFACWEAKVSFSFDGLEVTSFGAVGFSGYGVSVLLDGDTYATHDDLG